mmetsp:Transcript_60782/g.130604  ORF Transcript_60782/g.130604 Transcript_60782/m.130604 type:complete len:204 (-) Transcript_60782:46-657(-)
MSRIEFSPTASPEPAEQQADASDGSEDGGNSVSRRTRSRTASLGLRGTVLVPVRAGLSEPQVQELREVFALFEVEGTGKVSPSAVKSAASAAQLERESPEVWRMLAGLTSEEPVDFEEFLQLVTEPLGDHLTKAGASRLFGLLGQDAASKGSFGLEDLQSMAKGLGLEVDEEDLEDLLEKAGADAERRVGIDDFYEVMRGEAD